MQTVGPGGFSAVVAEEGVERAPFLVLGIGNILLTDEGFGPRVVAALGEDAGLAGMIDAVDGGTLSFSLLPEFDGRDGLIVVDCARFRAEPGTVRLFEGAELDALLKGASLSVHEVALSDLIDAARLCDGMPPRCALIAVEPADIGWGLDLSPAVAGALAEAGRLIAELVTRWRIR